MYLSLSIRFQDPASWFLLCVSELYFVTQWCTYQTLGGSAPRSTGPLNYRLLLKGLTTETYLIECLGEFFPEHTHTCARTHTYTCTHTHACTHAHAHTHMHAHTCTFACTHTHACTHSAWRSVCLPFRTTINLSINSNSEWVGSAPFLFAMQLGLL